jgi:hypothetical protein
MDVSLLLAVALQSAATPALNPELQSLAFLAGFCWRGTFANRPGETDTHCFTPMLGGRFLRDVHVVEGAAAPYSGETVYRLDRDSGEIRFHYYSSEGFTSSGAARPTETGIEFPEETYRGTDGQMTVRSRWTRDGPDAYHVISESLLRDGTWEEAWRMRMIRVGPAPLAPR